MLKKVISSLVFLLLFVSTSNAQSIDNLKIINTVWSKFYKAFETLDYTLMAEIHAKELVRISGGKRILDYDTYVNNYKSGYKRDKETNQTSNISLRFFERINNDSTASERGIYKLVRNKGTEKEKAYYGQFHVLFKKTNDEWKIIMDYDSSESETIDEDNYKKAYALDDFDKFVIN